MYVYLHCNCYGRGYFQRYIHIDQVGKILEYEIMILLKSLKSNLGERVIVSLPETYVDMLIGVYNIYFYR